MNIKQHTLQTGERLLLVPVPINSYDHYIHRKNLLFDLKEYPNCGIIRNIPKGNWQLIGISDEITEEQAVKLGFTSIESFHSVLQSLGCEGRYAVLLEH
jgi:hypothetical protein